MALACGNAVVWKPSEKTPLTALAVQAIFGRAARRFGDAPAGLSAIVFGGRTVGEVLVDHPTVPVASATGSSQVGRAEVFASVVVGDPRKHDVLVGPLIARAVYDGMQDALSQAVVAGEATAPHR